MAHATSQIKARKPKVPKGFTLIELFIVLALFGSITALISLPLATLQGDTALRDAKMSIKDALRRAETQSMSGYLGAGWGVHLSGATGCDFPATQYYIFQSNAFDSASDTTDVFDVPDGSNISAVSIGGGCDVKFTRFHGSTTNTGSVTIQSVSSGDTESISINQYGRISE